MTAANWLPNGDQATGLGQIPVVPNDPVIDGDADRLTASAHGGRVISPLQDRVTGVAQSRIIERTRIGHFSAACGGMRAPCA